MSYRPEDPFAIFAFVVDITSVVPKRNAGNWPKREI